MFATAHPARMARCAPLVAVALLTTIAASTPATAADDWPVLRQGRWQFDRTIEGMGPAPQKISRTECIDPTANLRRQQEQLAKSGCTFTPVTRRGDEYRYGATCRMGKMSTRSESVLTVHGTDAYTLRVSSTVDGESTKEVLVAKRVGDCGK